MRGAGLVARRVGLVKFGRVPFAGASALAMLVACLVLGAPTAVGKGVVDSFGQDQGLTFASGVGINQTTGDVYVADAATSAGGGHRVLQFTADGDLVRAWGWGVATGAEAFEICTTACRPGIEGAGDGQFSLQYGNEDLKSPQVAVDQTDGSVYVADNGNGRIQKFSAAGGYVGQLGGDQGLSMPRGVAVDPVSGDVYVADSDNNRVLRFDDAGVLQSQIGAPGGGSGDGDFLSPTRVSVDSTGRLYVLDADNGRVQRFAADGAFDEVFATGAYNAPTDLTVDPADDHVYIAASNADFTGQGILEFDANGAGVDAHAMDAGILGFSAGMAVHSATGRIYASSPIDPKAVMVLDDVAPATVSIDDVTDVTATEGTFSGTINPQGPPTTRYRFEYSTDGVCWRSVSDPGCDASGGTDIGEGTSDVPVVQAVTGLEPNTEYRVRLVATKDFNAGTTVSDEVTFTTGTEPPQVRALAAGSRSDGVAWLGGEVNPRNLATTYFVEYTLAADTDYSEAMRVPAAPPGADAGSGGEFVTVSELATGLAAGSEYRFRVVATNAAGTTVGPERTFTTRAAAPAPPAGRGYEMVSPLDKNGGDIDRDLPTGEYSTSAASSSGNVVAYPSVSVFAGAGSGSAQTTYRSVRGEDGWSTRGITAPVVPESSRDIVSSSVWSLSDDLARAVVGTNASLSPGAAGLLGGSWGLYLQDDSGSFPTYRLLSQPFAPLEPDTALGGDLSRRFEFTAASGDLRHVAFQANGRQLTADGAPDGIYAWTDGQVRFVSRLPSGEPVGASTGSAVGAPGFTYPGDHAVSDDGERIFFTAGGSVPGPLYVREGDDATTALSVSEREEDEDDDEVRLATFQAASAADGAQAIFTSSAQLTEGATACSSGCDGGPKADMYLWDAQAPEGHRLTDLTTGDTAGADVLGIAAATDDVSHVFFVARGELAPGAIRGRPNLYGWSAGSGVRHVATLAAGDGGVWANQREDLNAQFRDARVSADGSRLLFASRARVSAHDNAGTKQLYLYDLATDRLECVSCPSSGVASQGDSWLFYATGRVEPSRMPVPLPRNLSENGSRVLFETRQKLVNDDSNGQSDVYQWVAGELSLISSGKGAEGAKLVGASASGDDVFFTTREQLVGRDVDHQVDVYDARVGGGFADDQIPPPCVGDQCQGPLASVPTLPSPAHVPAAGDPPVLKRASLSVGKLSSHQRRALAAGRVAVMSVRVNKAGRVEARGTAKIGKRSRTVLSAAKHARAAGRVRLSLRLAKAGRVQLNRAGRLRVSLSVRFTGASEPSVLRLKLVSAATAGKGR